VANAVGLQPEAIKAVPVRHPGRWVAAIVVGAIAAYIFYTVVTAIQNDHTAQGSGWAAVGHYLFNPLARALNHTKRRIFFHLQAPQMQSTTFEEHEKNRLLPGRLIDILYTSRWFNSSS